MKSSGSYFMTSIKAQQIYGISNYKSYEILKATGPTHNLSDFFSLLVNLKVNSVAVVNFRCCDEFSISLKMYISDNRTV